MKVVRKIGIYKICVSRGLLYLRWSPKNSGKRKSQRINASVENLDEAEFVARSMIRVLIDPADLISPASNGNPTFREVWLAYEQAKRATLSSKRFRLLENRRDLYFKPF